MSGLKFGHLIQPSTVGLSLNAVYWVVFPITFHIWMNTISVAISNVYNGRYNYLQPGLWQLWQLKSSFFLMEMCCLVVLWYCFIYGVRSQREIVWRVGKLDMSWLLANILCCARFDTFILCMTNQVTWLKLPIGKLTTRCRLWAYRLAISNIVWRSPGRWPPSLLLLLQSNFASEKMTWLLKMFGFIGQFGRWMEKVKVSCPK